MIAKFKHYSGDQNKKNEIVWECCTYGKQEGCIQGFGGGNLRKTDHLENTRVSGEGGGVIFKNYLQVFGLIAWTGSSWLRIRTGGGHL